MNADGELMNYMARVMGSGATKIVLPKELVAKVSKKTLEEIKRWCKLNKVEITGIK